MHYTLDGLSFSQTAYEPRAGFFAALLCVPVLAAASGLFARGFAQPGVGRAAALPLAALLVFSCVLEILRLAALLQRLYPGSIRLSAVCLLLLLPVLYLRRGSALSQCAYAVLCGSVGTGVLLLVSAAPFLRLPNLSAHPLTLPQLGEALGCRAICIPTDGAGCCRAYLSSHKRKMKLMKKEKREES